MGGSQGYVSIAIAEKFPNLKFIVQDTAGMRTTSTIGKVPAELQDRVELTTHDFFTPQTVDAEVYFFRWIFHGFSEKYCIKILQALIPALKKGAKIVINDGVLPDPGNVSYIEEKSMRYLHLSFEEEKKKSSRVLTQAQDHGYDYAGDCQRKRTRSGRLGRIVQAS